MTEKMKDLPKIDYKRIIEENFMILDLETQQPVPFKFRYTTKDGAEHFVQELFYNELLKTYGPTLNGIREIILKARQEGFSSLILALFAADFLFRPYSVSICISHKKGATEILFKKVKFYLQSYCEKNGITMKDLLKKETTGMIENRLNNSVFYIGTAGSKVGGRGASARNIHFSEAAFYQDTELITASEIIIATAQQVHQDQGMIFIESTANGEGNYYQEEWERAQDGLSTYIPRFYGWDKFYTKEWVEKKRKDFPNDMLWKQEYPLTPEEAFRTSGSPFFDLEALNRLEDEKTPPIQTGRLAADGMFV